MAISSLQSDQDAVNLRAQASPPSKPFAGFDPHGGEEAALLVVHDGPGAAAVSVETSGGDGPVRITRRTTTRKLHNRADAIAEMLREHPTEVLARAGAIEGAWRWNLTTDEVLLSASAARLLGMSSLLGHFGTPELLVRVCPGDRGPLLVALGQAAATGAVLDCYVSLLGGRRAPRLRVIGRLVDGARPMFVGVMRRATRV